MHAILSTVSHLKLPFLEYYPVCTLPEETALCNPYWNRADLSFVRNAPASRQPTNIDVPNHHVAHQD